LNSRRRANATGRNPNGVERKLIIRRSLMHSPQYSALSLTSRGLFLELQGMFNGTNNGTLFLSVKDAAARLGLSDLKPVTAAFNELMALGFLTEAIGASFSIKTAGVSKARAWTRNLIDRVGLCAGPDELPPPDFKSLTKAQKSRMEKRGRVLSNYLGNYQKGKFAVEDSSTLDARRDFAGPNPVEDSSTTNAENRSFPPIHRVEDSSNYLEYHGGVGPSWWMLPHVIQAQQSILALFQVPAPLKAAA
jgi:hypothetical protein